MHVANFIENTEAPPKTGQLSWALDASIIAGATLAIIVTVIPAGLWVHRSQDVTAPHAFTSAANPDAAEAKAGAIGAPLLWRVTNGQATVWLFGNVATHHRDLGWMDSRLFQAFDGADQVWLDAVPPLPRDGDITAERGAGVLLSQRAARLNKPVTAFGPFARTNEDVVMTSLWRKGDERGLLARASYLGMLDGSENAGRVAAALQGDQTVFVALDVAQLIGPNGLVAQLRSAGYTVERLDP